MNEQNEETWKNIEHSDFYVSNWGRVWNIQTKKFIRAHVHKSRANYYLRVNLGKRKKMVHVLVASYFHENVIGAKAQVDHKDTNTLNNSATNLKWVTSSENHFLKHLRNKVVL